MQASLIRSSVKRRWSDGRWFPLKHNVTGWWLSLPLRKIWKSIGMMKFPTEWENKECSKPPIRSDLTFFCATSIHKLGSQPRTSTANKNATHLPHYKWTHVYQSTNSICQFNKETCHQSGHESSHAISIKIALNSTKQQQTMTSPDFFHLWPLGCCRLRSCGKFSMAWS